MNRRNVMKTMGAVSAAPAVLAAARAAPRSEGESFSFAFVTDAHINWRMGQVRDRELPSEREDVLETPFVGYRRALPEFLANVEKTVGRMKEIEGAVWSGARAVRDTTFGGTTAAHSQGYLVITTSGNEIDWKHYPFNFDAEKYHYEKTGIKPYGVSMYWHLKQMKQK